jgi:MFS family permease
MPGPAWDDRTVVADSQASDPMGSLALLRANRPLRLLWTARTVSFLDDSLSLVALMLYVGDATGAALAVALLLLVGDFAPALLVPLTGTVSDRFALKRIMLGCEAAQARWSR